MENFSLNSLTNSLERSRTSIVNVTNDPTTQQVAVENNVIQNKKSFDNILKTEIIKKENRLAAAAQSAAEAAISKKQEMIQKDEDDAPENINTYSDIVPSGRERKVANSKSYYYSSEGNREEGLFDNTMVSVEKEIGKASKHQEVIAQNIANAATKGYIPKMYDGETGEIVNRPGRTSVNIEEEMAEMAQIRHSSYIKIMSSKLAILRSIVTQGKK